LAWLIAMHAVNASAALTDWVPVSHSHGPCFAAAATGNSDSELEEDPSLLEMLRWDQHRADYIQSMLGVGVGVGAPVNDSKVLPPPAPTSEKRHEDEGH
jgi:hypothetical protein